MRTALTINHVAYEDAGTLATELAELGFYSSIVDACTADLREIDPLSPDLLIVLGGAIGVYERDAYPFVDDEIALIRARLEAKRPTLGICLGAQLVAAALGAKVYPGSQGKEIGWAPVEAGKDAALYPAFVSLLAESRCFLHWHGDTFELPPHARHLAATPRYPNQAFAIENYALGLQFHPEVTARGLERWYVGNACELANAKIDVARLREESRRFAPQLEVAARRFWRAWLDETFAAPPVPKSSAPTAPATFRAVQSAEEASR